MKASSGALVAFVALVAVAAYWPALSGGFIWDDDALLTLNPLVKAGDGLYRMWFTTQAVDYWPVTGTSFWIEWRLWGLHASGYHLTNLLLHIGSGLLLWRILRQLAIPGPALAAGFFLLHPVNVESVAWIAERKNTLSLVFLLLSALWFLESRRWYWLSFGAFVLAMLSKGSVAILPVLLLLIIWWRQGTITRTDLARTAPFFVVAVGLTLVNIWFQARGLTGPIRDATVVERLLGAGAVLWFYIYKALVPINLMFVYPEWDIRADAVQWWLPMAAALLLTAILIWQRRRPLPRALLLVWACFCVSLVPVMGLTDVYFMKYSLVADHYQYIALLAVVAGVAAGASRLAEFTRARPVEIGCGILMLLLGIATWRGSQQYASAETIYRSTLSRNPRAWMVHNNLGLFLLRRSKVDFQEGLGHLQTALAIKPNDPSLHNNLGIALFQMDRFEEAAREHQEAVRLSPNYLEAYVNLGADLRTLGRHSEAVDAFRHALRINPELGSIRSDLAAELQAAGRAPEANAELQHAAQDSSSTVEGRGAMGDALLHLGRTEEAIAQYRQALQIDPNSAPTLNNLGYALMVASRYGEAERALRQAARLQPEDAAIHDNLGNVLQQMQRLDEAVAEFKAALRTGTGNLAEIHNDLGVAYAMQGRRDDAIAEFREAVRLKPGLATAQANLAKALGIGRK